MLKIELYNRNDHFAVHTKTKKITNKSGNHPLEI